jgi:predicted ATPase
MITKLYVNNYKTLVDFTVEFQPLTLIVGGNGTGKSAITEILNAISLFSRGKSELKASFPRETLSRFCKGNLNQDFTIFANFYGVEFEYSLILTHHLTRDEVSVMEERIVIDSKVYVTRGNGFSEIWDDYQGTMHTGINFSRASSFLNQLSMFNMDGDFSMFIDFFMKYLSIYQINPFSIAGFAKEESEILSRHGDNFSAWYRHNQSEHPLKLPSLYSEIANFMPGFTHFRLSGAEGRRAIMCEFSNGTSIDFDYLSEGQKSLILLYSILIFSEGNRVPGQTLIFDEPDNFIALREIQPWLRMVESWVAQGKRQAILISHHPGVINFEGDEKVVWLVRENGGPTSLRTPTDLRETSLADQLVWDQE